MKVANDYYKLIERFPLLHIRNDEQLDEAQSVIDDLVDKLSDKKISAGERLYLDALSDLVVAYESKRFDSATQMSPVELLEYLMQENRLDQRDLAPLFGGQSRVSDFLNGKRALSKTQIQNLAERFRLSPLAFFVAEVTTKSKKKKGVAKKRGERATA